MRIVCLLCIAIFSFTIYASSQASDFIVIRKNGVTIKSFLKGAYVKFFVTNGEYIESYITDIRNDSMYFKQIIVRQIGTPWGVPNLDTVATPIRSITYNEIDGIPRLNESFSYIKNGTLPMIGGGGYILLNLVNGAYLRDAPFGKKNLPGMAIATGVFSVGLLMNKLHKPFIKIGKKYSLEYIRINSK